MSAKMYQIQVLRFCVLRFYQRRRTQTPSSSSISTCFPRCLLYRATGSMPQAVVAMDTSLFGPALDLLLVLNWILYPPQLVWKGGEAGEQQGSGEWWKQGRWRS